MPEATARAEFRDNSKDICGGRKAFEKKIYFPFTYTFKNFKKENIMIHNIIDYGAQSDGKLCTKNIQSAIDACFLAGGGEVVIPEGDFITGGLRLRTGVTLHLLENAHLIGSIDPEDYLVYLNDELEPISLEEREMITPTAMPDCTSQSARPYSRWNNAIIRAINAENISIIGERGSEINGRNCFDEIGEERYRGPHAINIWFSKNITLRGYTIRDSANWAHAIQNSQEITMTNVTILGGHDGFDVRTCDNVLVEDCTFCTGDDCIAGFDNINVTVRRCILETACSVLRFGGNNVLVEDCKGGKSNSYGFRGNLTSEEKRSRADTNEKCRHNCLTVYLSYSDKRAVIREKSGNTVFRNCVFNNPDTIVNIPYGHVWCSNGSLNDITFENCSFEGVITPSNLNGCPEEPVDITFKNCRMSAKSGFENISLFEGENAKSITLDNVAIENYTDPTVKCNEDCNVKVVGENNVKVIHIKEVENKTKYFL